MITHLTLADILSAFLYLIIGLFITAIVYPLSKSRFHISYHKNPKNIKRISKCSHIKKGIFIPTPYLASGLLQAAFGKSSVHSDPNIQFEEELLNLPCGGMVGLHWATQVTVSDAVKAKAKKVIVIMLPGLTASSREPYIRNVSSEALENGYKVVVYQNRGNRVEMVLPKEGYLDQIMDFRYTVEQVKKTLPDHKIFAIGHSYGANTLVNYLARFKEDHYIEAAASIANPFDFIKAATGIHDTIFDKFLAQTMQGWAKRNEKALLGASEHFEINYEEAMKATTLKGFDEHVTRRIFGFPDVRSYYKGIRSTDNVQHINIPLLVMNAKDDPVINYIACPIEECLNNENIIVILTHNGGHVGWFEGIFKPKRWYPKPTVEFLNSCYYELMESVK